MPRLSRYFIKVGLIYFVVGLLLGTVMLLQPLLNWSSKLQALRPVYLHFLFIGWVTQIIMGVAYWMFPKFSRAKPRANEHIGWAVFVLLNTGLILRAIAEPAPVIIPDANLAWILAPAAICLLLSGWLFIINTWGRIKER